ncbi:flippase [Gaoshiqia sediminis]|uniref:Flippase n=1 Tax=Gaoshiqia sediminis TaxID=2986998 RepID=A0AA41YEW2_9BACT|nr:flippase [Gaoshiqia sediminis]MCW0484737.1 flippase [Gaoshiqia sediminis]
MKQHYHKIKEGLSRNKTLVQNFSYLSALQIFNLLLPLITYPYLIRVLGKETYGLVVFAQAIIGYLVILVGFGFNISATKEISIHRDDKKKVSEIVSGVIILKSGLFILSFLILGILLFYIPQAKGYEPLFILCMWACLYDVIFPMWYFQGIEQMKYITYITLVSRFVSIGLIFVLIHAPEDYLFLPIVNGIGAIVAGVISLVIVFGPRGVKFHFCSYTILKRLLLDSVPIFVSNVSIRLYVSTNKVIVGAFLGMAEVAYYDMGEKVTNLLKIPQSMLSQTLFPKINKDKNIEFVKKAFRLSIILNIGLMIGTILFSKYIVIILGGQQMMNAIWVLNILVLTIPVIAMSNIFGIQLLIPFGYSKRFSQIILSSGMIYLLQFAILWLFNLITIYSMSIITVTTELFVTLIMYQHCKRYKLW